MTQYDVIVIGAGPAGLSAAILLADTGKSAIVIGDGRSSLSSALVGNYLGISEPILGSEFLTQAREQVKAKGVQITDEKVIAFSRNGEMLTIQTENTSYQAKNIILAGGMAAGVPTAEMMGVELIDNDEPFAKKKAKVDERFRTSVPNVYVAGILAGVSSQAIVAAGSGAQVALNLVSDLEGKRIHHHQSPAKK